MNGDELLRFQISPARCACGRETFQNAWSSEWNLRFEIPPVEYSGGQALSWGRGGTVLIFKIALPAFLPSVICSVFFTQNKGRGPETGGKLISSRHLQCLNTECLNCIARILIIPKIECYMTAEHYIFEGEGVCVERGGGKGDGMGCNSLYSDRATFFFSISSIYCRFIPFW